MPDTHGMLCDTTLDLTVLYCTMFVYKCGLQSYDRPLSEAFSLLIQRSNTDR